MQSSFKMTPKKVKPTAGFRRHWVTHKHTDSIYVFKHIHQREMSIGFVCGNKLTTVLHTFRLVCCCSFFTLEFAIETHWIMCIRFRILWIYRFSTLVIDVIMVNTILKSWKKNIETTIWRWYKTFKLKIIFHCIPMYGRLGLNVHGANC